MAAAVTTKEALEPPDKLWNSSLEDKLQSLKHKDRERLKGLLDYSTFKQSLDGLLINQMSTSSAKVLLCIEPVVEGLTSFSQAISSISQGNPFASIGWGVVQILLEVSQWAFSA